MERRKFIKNTSIGTAGIACGLGSIFIQSCTSTQRVQGSFQNNQLSIALSDLSDQTFVLTNHPNKEDEIALVNVENSWIALNTACTHKGCPTKKVGARFNCPCHGAEFSLSGKVLKGPANEDLISYKTAITEQELIIFLS